MADPRIRKINAAEARECLSRFVAGCPYTALLSDLAAHDAEAT